MTGMRRFGKIQFLTGKKSFHDYVQTMQVKNEAGFVHESGFI
jgi:hypothetical protein